MLKLVSLVVAALAAAAVAQKPCGEVALTCGQMQAVSTQDKLNFNCQRNADSLESTCAATNGLKTLTVCCDQRAFFANP